MIIERTQGLVAQWTRARGYGPRCRGFESLLARSIKGCTCLVHPFSIFHFLFKLKNPLHNQGGEERKSRASLVSSGSVQCKQDDRCTREGYEHLQPPRSRKKLTLAKNPIQTTSPLSRHHPQYHEPAVQLRSEGC